MPRVKGFERAAALLAVIGILTLGAASSAVAGPTRVGSRPTQHLRLQLLGIHGRQVRVRLWLTGGVDHHVVIDVRCAHRTVATAKLTTLTTKRRTVVITVRRGVPFGGVVTVDVTARR